MMIDNWLSQIYSNSGGPRVFMLTVASGLMWCRSAWANCLIRRGIIERDYDANKSTLSFENVAKELKNCGAEHLINRARSIVVAASHYLFGGVWYCLFVGLT